MMSKKIKVGIDINEILRHKWLQFDRFYVDEFGEDGVPKNPYVYDYFNNYVFNDTVEIEKELKDEEDIPDINPIYYQQDENGESQADAFLFKAPKENKLTAKDVYNRFMYIDYCFEIFGSAPFMYKNMDVDFNKFVLKYKNNVEFILFSVENNFTIKPTQFFLSKVNTTVKNIKFVDKSIDMWNDCDVLITTDPTILKLGKPWFKNLIKLNRPYNMDVKFKGISVLQLNDLNSNKEFEKIIKYKEKK
jgi:hypothetical protein